ncbi:MAG: hypothetical protein ACSLE1_04470 [Sphingobium sp.]
MAGLIGLADEGQVDRLRPLAGADVCGGRKRAIEQRYRERLPAGSGISVLCDRPAGVADGSFAIIAK